MGNVHATVAEPREIFRMAILKGVSSIIMVHNHPSNNVQPSKPDLKLTEQVVAAGRIIGIRVLDHVIICEDGHYSFYLDGKIG
jgi:DNA repair protein RadC